MSTDAVVQTAGDCRTFSLIRVLPSLLRDPVGTLLEIGRQARGEIIQINVGPFRPYLVTNPDHLQHILRGNAANYTREGVFWRPLHRLFGHSIMSDGPPWARSRKVLQPVFTAKHVESLAQRMADAIADGIDGLAEPVASGRPIDVPAEMARIVNTAVVKIFFGDKISMADTVRLAPAFNAVGTSVVFRYLLPFLPESVPVPGDRAFHRALRTIDDIVVPLVERYRYRPGDGDDIVSVLCRAGGHDDPVWVRDNLVAMLATATETTAGALTWFWPLLHSHRDVAARLQEEIDHVVGGERVQPEHLARLQYTKQVVQEVLRLFPVGWLFPRMVVAEENVGGVRLKQGRTVLISPYITHRLGMLWDRPDEFDPDRFSGRRSAGRHRYAYFPFGGGPHQCIGMYVFTMEAHLIIAGILSRYRQVACSPEVATPRMGASLRPREHVEIVLRPVRDAGQEGGA